MQRNRPSVAGEVQCDGAPNAFGGAGDQSNAGDGHGIIIHCGRGPVRHPGVRHDYAVAFWGLTLSGPTVSTLRF